MADQFSVCYLNGVIMEQITMHQIIMHQQIIMCPPKSEEFVHSLPMDKQLLFGVEMEIVLKQYSLKVQLQMNC